MGKQFMLCLLLYFCAIPTKAQTDAWKQNDPKAMEAYRHLFGGTISNVEWPEREIAQRSSCGTQLVFRNITGECNNIVESAYGSAGIPLLRVLPAEYEATDPLNGLGGGSRPNPRIISNRVFKKEANADLKSTTLSSFVFSWGQFLDHDIGISPEGETEVANIFPTGEPGDLITVPIPFHRSEVEEGTGINSPREQFNVLTSWIDGSQIYGSDVVRATWLRQGTHGKLKTSAGNLLPYNTLNGEATGAIDPDAPAMANNLGLNLFFIAGDVRANEQLSLTALHTLFVREHNRMCDELIALNNYDPYWDDETIFKKARKKVVALLQHITFSEFLPALGITLENYSGYNNAVRPDLTNVFSTAAFRLGHTMVSNELLLLDDNGEAVAGGSISLIDAFFNPNFVATNGIEPILKGISVQFQEEVDAKIVEELRTFLFAPGAGAGFDLASLNIQRGRDHGLADYNAYRTLFTSNAASSIADITTNPTLQEALETLYADVNDIDPWVGFLAEDKLPNAELGPTLQSILTIQFRCLRDGDYYFYLNDPACANDIATIEQTRLSDIVIRNTTLENIQENVFHPDDCLPVVVYTEDDPVLEGTEKITSVSNYIQAANTIHAGGTATYDARNFICLTTGFLADQESIFLAELGGCSSTNASRVGEKPKVVHTEKVSTRTPEESKIFTVKENSATIRNYPNPFADKTIFEFSLPETTPVHLEVFDVTGKSIAIVLSNKAMPKGLHQTTFDASQLSNGIYAYRLTTKNEMLIQKMVIQH